MDCAGREIVPELKKVIELRRQELVEIFTEAHSKTFQNRSTGMEAVSLL